MKTFLIKSLLLCGLLYGSTAHADDMMLLGVGNQRHTAGSTTTFDPSNLGSHNVLSNGNLTSTGAGGGASQYDLARSITSHSTGKFYFETTVNQRGTNNDAIGLSNANLPATGSGSGPGFDGTNADIALYTGTTGIFYNSGSIGAVATAPLAGDVIGVAVDAGGSLLWMVNIVGGTTQGNWNNSGAASPATGTGGISISGVTGGLFAYFACSQADSNCQGTANFGGSTYAITAHGSGVPSGFGNY